MAINNGLGSTAITVDVNVTPLIDILLVLLIIFMLMVPAMPYGLATEVPKRTSPPGGDGMIVVQILAAGDGRLTYKINQNQVALDGLGKKLVALFSSRADKVLAIKGDDRLDYSAVAQVIDIGKAAGADHIRLITPNDAI
jgi:biopolymer transport protein TolR